MVRVGKEQKNENRVARAFQIIVLKASLTLVLTARDKPVAI